ncbi:MAG: PD40 domain-containing protein [Anaerolineae bacterium]|nr:PD40 domain-containing protein [Anaerolineae bacterium]
MAGLHLLKRLALILGLLLLTGRLAAQDGLDLPTPLYVLSNTGQVQRIGLGAEGLSVVTPPDAYVVDFGVAPDGRWLAYRTESGLFLSDLSGSQTLPLQEQGADLPPTRGRGVTITWSPRGDALAYTTSQGARIRFNADPEAVFTDIYEGPFTGLLWSPNGDFLAAEAENNIWWFYQRDGFALKLTSAIPSSVGLAWINPAEVIFAPAEGGLIQMNLAAANSQTVLLDDTAVYALPALRPDGTLVVFERPKADETVPEGSGRLVSLPPGSANLERGIAPPLELEGLRWAPGARLALALRGGVLALLLPESGQGFALPITDVVGYIWGPPPLEVVSGLEMTADLTFVSADATDVRQLWRLPRDGGIAVSLTAAEADITDYAVSPNGTALAYISGGALYVQPADDPAGASILVESAGVFSGVVFSPDGQRVAYALDGNEGGVFILPTRGGEPAQLLVNNPETAVFDSPQFALNVNALSARRSAPDGTNGVVWIDLATNEAIELGAADETWWLRSGDLLARSGDRLLRYDPVNFGQITTLGTLPLALLNLRDYSAARVGLVLSSPQPGPQQLVLADLRVTTGEFSRIGDGGFMVDPLLSPDGAYLAGYTTPGGPLTLREISSGRQVVMREPPGISLIEWVLQR